MDRDSKEDPTVRKGGYVYASQQELEAIQAQRAATWEWLKELGLNLLRSGGLNLTTVSMPVTLFEPRSWLERMCDNWAYLDLLEAASQRGDPVGRMRYLAAFVVGGLRQQVSFGKPFNPILGETLQAEFEGTGARHGSGSGSGSGSGTTAVFAEQISHHPPTSAWLLLDGQGRFTFWGTGTWAAMALGNSVRGCQSGTNTARFASDGAEVTWELPQMTIQGVLFGERTLKYHGRLRLEDTKNKVVCELEVDPTGAPSLLSSALSLQAWMPRLGWQSEGPEDQVVGTLKARGRVVDSLSGSWLSHLEWAKGGEGGRQLRIWDAGSSPVRRVVPVDGALLSDSRFREDLAHLRAGNTQGAQRWKVQLEQAQRHDRRLRGEAGVSS